MPHPGRWLDGKSANKSNERRRIVDCVLLFFLEHHGFSSQTLSPQSFVVSPKGFLCFFVFRDGLLGTKSLMRSLRACERLIYCVIH